MAPVVNAVAGPSKRSALRDPPSKFKVKTISRTADLLRENQKANGRDGERGKGKERDVLGQTFGLAQHVNNLPGAIQVERFAEARALEILAFQNAIKSAVSFGNSRIFQSLPRHLRRRAASHNPRRVPKRLRSKAAAEIDPGDNIAKLHRRRAKLRAKGDLRGYSRTEQLQRRQRDKTWLPTHIWHAKRFHMVNLWGYRLPLTPTLKSFRPAYRAARRKCAVQDTSYYGILELAGDRADVIAVLEKVTAGRFAGSRFEDGSTMANIQIHQPDTYPLGLIGPAEVLWQQGESHHTIWLRLHPAIFRDVATAIRRATLAVSRGGGNVQIQMHDLRGEIDSFELTGPLSGDMLRRILRVCRTESANKRGLLDSLAQLQHSSEMPAGTVMGLQIYDPRLRAPSRPLKRVDRPSFSDGISRAPHLPSPSSEIARSDIWDAAVREALEKPRYKKSELDNRRHKLKSPGSTLRPLYQDDRLPILLVQRSITSPSAPVEAMHGYTLLVPRGWAQYFLHAFAYAGCLVAGLQERRAQYCEAGVPCFPEDTGAICPAGVEAEERKAKEEEERWRRKPPGKRPEYGLLGTPWAFQPNWSAIVRESGAEEAEEEAMNGTPSFNPWLVNTPLVDLIPRLAAASAPCELLMEIINAFRIQRSMAPYPASRAAEMFTSAIVHVRVCMLGRGSSKDMAYVYSLDGEERGRWLRAHSVEQDLGRADWIGLEGEAKSEIQRLGEIFPDLGKVIGFVSTGNFSLSRGAGHALAAVTLKGYLGLLALGQDGSEEWRGEAIVKLRNREGRICRLAKLEMV